MARSWGKVWETAKDGRGQLTPGLGETGRGVCRIPFLPKTKTKRRRPVCVKPSGGFTIVDFFPEQFPLKSRT